MHNKNPWRLNTAGALACLLLQAGCGSDDSTPAANTAAPAAWVGIATQAVQNDAAANPPGMPPVTDSRVFALAFIASHDALNAIDRRYRPYLTDTSAPTANPDVAVATAVYTVMKAQVPSQQSYLDAQYATALAAVPDGAGKTAGVTLGQLTANAVLAARADDGAASANSPPYTPASVAPGVYQATPPVNVALLTGWGAVKPFVLTGAAQFRAPADYKVTDPAYTVDYVEAKAFGAANGSSRTAEQSQIAKFWLENTTQSWAHIAVQLAAAKGLNGWDQARLYAVLEVGQADAAISILEAKYFYAFWRPITAVRAGDNDSNVDTVGDVAWAPFDPVTPPIPDYPSNHAGSAGAGRMVLQTLLGGDAIPGIDYSSSSLPGVTRHYTSLSQIEGEIGDSRVYVGYHFRNAVNKGLAQGESVGSYVVANTMLPK